MRKTTMAWFSRFIEFKTLSRYVYYTYMLLRALCKH